MLFSSLRRIINCKPTLASVCTHQAVVEVKRDKLAWPPLIIPIELIGLMSLLPVPARRTDFNSTSPWNTLLGLNTSFSGVKRIRLPLLSMALRIWMSICSSEVCDKLAAVVNTLLNVPEAIGCAELTNDTPSPPAYALLKARFRMLAHKVSFVSIRDCAKCLA